MREVSDAASAPASRRIFLGPFPGGFFPWPSANPADAPARAFKPHARVSERKVAQASSLPRLSQKQAGSLRHVFGGEPDDQK
jgi:hypothetical protein